MTVPLLEARKLTKAFPGVRALDDVSLCFRPGEIHGLVGENGAGKSTAIKIVSGIYQPDAGEIKNVVPALAAVEVGQPPARGPGCRRRSMRWAFAPARSAAA